MLSIETLLLKNTETWDRADLLVYIAELTSIIDEADELFGPLADDDPSVKTWRDRVDEWHPRTYVNKK